MAGSTVAVVAVAGTFAMSVVMSFISGLLHEIYWIEYRQVVLPAEGGEAVEKAKRADLHRRRQ